MPRRTTLEIIVEQFQCLEGGACSSGIDGMKDNMFNASKIRGNQLKRGHQHPVAAIRPASPEAGMDRDFLSPAGKGLMPGCGKAAVGGRQDIAYVFKGVHPVAIGGRFDGDYVGERRGDDRCYGPGDLALPGAGEVVAVQPLRPPFRRIRLGINDAAAFDVANQDRSRHALSHGSERFAPSQQRLPLIREFRYEYAAVSPWDGALDYMTADKMNTENMSSFLAQVSTNHPNEFNIMIVDGASSHKSKDLIVPENVALVLLPPYSPELNPAEQIWNQLRKNYFANKVFDSLDAATQQAERGLSVMASNREAMSSLTNWPWIKSINLIAK